MKTRYLMLSALAAATVACGGGVDQNSAEPKQTTVYVETSSAITVQDAVNGLVTIACTNAGTTYGPYTLTYAASSGTFKSAFELPNAAATYSCDLSVRNAGGTLIGSSVNNTLIVAANKLTTLTITLPSSTTAAPAFGFVLSASSGPGYIDNLATGNFSVTVAKAAAAPEPVYAWTATTSSGAPCDGSFSNAAISTPAYTAGATPQLCTIKVTIKDADNANLKQEKAFTVGLGVNVDPSVTFVPSPTIWKLEFASNGGYAGTFSFPPETAVTTAKKLSPAESTCTLLRETSGQTQASSTCTGQYKLNSALQELIDDPFHLWIPAVLTTVTPTFSIGVSYDLGGAYDAAKPPVVTATYSCPTFTTLGGFQTFAGAVVTGTNLDSVTVTGSDGGVVLKWLFPSVGAAGLCQFTFNVNNKDVIDSYQAFVYLKP